MSYFILRILRLRDNPRKPSHESEDMSRKDPPVEDPTFLVDVISALNICLFPPLFFFSALYYTDVISTLVVLFAYTAHLAGSKSQLSFISNVGVLLFGIVSLFFRQTNIFWVAVFPAGLVVVNALKADAPSPTSSTRDIAAVLQDSWSKGMIADCSVQDTGVQGAQDHTCLKKNYTDQLLLDVVLFLISTVVAALSKPLLVLKVAIPYAILLVLFAGFVAWNGSVVLGKRYSSILGLTELTSKGDKSAHTATIHLPQMLYIWPYFAFFSLPLLLGPLLKPVVPILPERLRITWDQTFKTSIYRLPSLLAFGSFIAFALLAVHFNTIIHPYTLADNRHYVFYVFKLLRLYPALRYLAVPVYCVCAWLIIQALAAQKTASPPKSKETTSSKGKADSNLGPANRQPCQVSFVVIWLATTALSVVTAPLVEPRYFIIPWVIWRLHVPCNVATDQKASFGKRKSSEIRLVFEGLWHLAVNLVVSYTFLYRTFTWSSEPGNLQRFIW